MNGNKATADALNTLSESICKLYEGEEQEHYLDLCNVLAGACVRKTGDDSDVSKKQRLFWWLYEQYYAERAGILTCKQIQKLDAASPEWREHVRQCIIALEAAEL